MSERRPWHEQDLRLLVNLFTIEGMKFVAIASLMIAAFALTASYAIYGRGPHCILKLEDRGPHHAARYRWRITLMKPAEVDPDCA